MVWSAWGTHLNDISLMSLMLLELRRINLMHADLSWLERNAVIIHYHLGFKWLVDDMSVTRTNSSYLIWIQKHILLRLERLMHIVNLTVWSNSSSTLRHNLLLIHQFPTAWSYGSATSRCFLVSSLLTLSHHIVEGPTDHIWIIWIHTWFILSLACKLIIVVSAVWWTVVLSEHHVLVATDCRFYVIVILRGVEATAALLSAFIWGGWNVVLHADWLILAHAFHIFSNNVIFAGHRLPLRMSTLLTC